MEKVLTVSIAAYNVQDYIREALDPFIKVDGRERLEVLIVDDGATDNTLSIAEEYQEKYPDVFKAVHKNNGGWGSTVTTGIRMATGKYFKQLDGDDYYSTERLGAFLDDLEKYDADLIITDFVKFYDCTGRTEKPDTDFYKSNGIEYISFDEIPTTPYCLEMYALTFKTEVLKNSNVAITEHCFYTDNEYVLKSVTACKTIAKMPYCIYNYRLARPGQSVSIEGMRKHYKEFEYILKSSLEYMDNSHINPQLKKIFTIRLQGLSYYYYETLMKLGSDDEYKQHLINYDKWLKKNFKTIYLGIKYVPVFLLRKTNYRFYSLIRKFFS